MKKLILIISLLFFAAYVQAREEHRSLIVLSTNDVHGAYFPYTYVDSTAVCSLMGVKYVADSIRNVNGAQNVLLIDSGDILQGDNAAYFYNYVDTSNAHILPRLAAQIGYDVMIVGNHDVETGHPVYDRIRSDLALYGIPFLGGNAIDLNTGQPYFDNYALIEKAGIRILVLGYTNANIKAWLQEELWKGMDFLSLKETVQKDIDKYKSKFNPDLVIVAAHTGTGKGDSSILESQGLDLFNSLDGVDLFLSSHDHRPVAINQNGRSLCNSGSKAKFLGVTKLDLSRKKGKIVSKNIESSLMEVNPSLYDKELFDYFGDDYSKVKDFTLAPVGSLEFDMDASEYGSGMNSYVNFVHMVQLLYTGARVSLAAPLSNKGTVKRGELVRNDMFTIYPYENQLFVVDLTGKEIKDYLELSYEGWINGTSIYYNLDSAAGINYSVDPSKPYGQRIRIYSFADGSQFEASEVYSVAVNSYRASTHFNDRISERYPEVRELIYRYVKENGTISYDAVWNYDLLGQWKFEPSL